MSRGDGNNIEVIKSREMSYLDALNSLSSKQYGNVTFYALFSNIRFSLRMRPKGVIFQNLVVMVNLIKVSYGLFL